jgi:hypothetical protein
MTSARSAILALALLAPQAAEAAPQPARFGGDPSDCSLAETNPDPVYSPSQGVMTIQVVVHVIANGTCTVGDLRDDVVADQVEALREDFLALPGTPGAAGADTGIRFVLATVDPDGEPTDGIEHYCDEAWYQDDAPYWETIAWDPARYLNLYVNTADGARGYVPVLPATPGAPNGLPEDRVVINTLAFGRQMPPPVPQHAGGRTATHEIGHYLGLFHTYFGGCGADGPPDCLTTGDRICDTVPDAAAQDGCPVGATSCGGWPSPIENFMQLTDDPCMTGFTAEQALRMRCTVTHYRPGLLGPQALFLDDFETGDSSRWSASST